MRNSIRKITNRKQIRGFKSEALIDISQYIYGRFYVIEIPELFILAQGFFRSGVIFISSAFLDGLYHYIARSVLQTREFDHGNVISAAFKFKASKAVGQIFRQPVLQNTVLEHRLMEIVVYLAEELVLTAWYAEYHLGVPPDGVYKGIICGGITGVQRYHISAESLV